MKDEQEIHVATVMELGDVSESTAKKRLKQVRERFGKKHGPKAGQSDPVTYGEYRKYFNIQR